MLILADIPIPKVEVGGNVLILSVVFFALLCRYLIARFRHKQILAAIEKGLPLSNLKANKLQAPRWITYISFAIPLIMVSVCIVVFALCFFAEWTPSLFIRGTDEGTLPVVFLSIGIIILSVGVACLVRGLMLRKVEKFGTKTQQDSAESK